MHTIHNIAFEVDVNHNGQEVSWEQHYVEFLQDRLLPKVEILCNNWDAKYPNTKCSIESMDIEVEVDSLDDEELQKKIITKINDQLSNIDNNGKTSHGSVRATITSVASPFDALIRYLKDGVLPAYISVKIFKEWLGTIIQFTPTEKETLTNLFSANSETIERMLSLLQNNYQKFAAIIDSKQKITQQYIQFEETFFKKFLKVICEKIQISYQEKQAEIWFKTLEVSSSIAQFSKTFIQLVQPKANQEQKQLININEYQLAIVILQAVVQNDTEKAIHISVSKAFDVLSIKEEETTNQKATSTTQNNQVDRSNTTKNTVQTTENSNQVNTRVESDTNNTKARKNQSTEVDQQNNTTAETKKSELTSSEQLQSNNSSSNEIVDREGINKENNSPKSTTPNTISNSESTTKQKELSSSLNEEATTKEQTTTNNLSKSKVELEAEEIQKSADTMASAEKEGETNQELTSENDPSSTKKEKDTTQSRQQSANTTQNQNNQNQSSKHIDQTIFDKLSRNNHPVREIPLTTEKAGLILLNPFLVRFFTGANLINDDNKITDFEKACTLLHFIATGTEEVTDVELTLEKICLGIPLETIINYQTPLTDEDKALCDELLNAVIQNWSVLKNSTPNTLRDMFIKREGKITLKVDSIKLEVERYAQDILLDRIPWNISLFKLKWMDKMMHIEW